MDGQVEGLELLSVQVASQRPWRSWKRTIKTTKDRGDRDGYIDQQLYYSYFISVML